MKKILSTYVNCSMGGMTSVYRARALNNPDTHYDLVFTADQGGQKAFASIANCSVRIVRKDRLAKYLQYALAASDYEYFTVTSQPDVISTVDVPDNTQVIYEIHAPLEHIVKRELKALDTSKVDEIWAPSQWSVDLIRLSLPRRKHVPVICHANLLDGKRFSETGLQRFSLDGRQGMTPVSWIGRLENFHKNYIDFMRVLRRLPSNYYGLMLLSLQDDPERLSDALGSAAMLGVEDRIDIFWNVPQQKVGDLHRAVRDAGGVFCSTALSESFGYGVLEAAKCGTPVVAYNVGPLAEHDSDDVHLVPVGDLVELAESIMCVSKTAVE